MPAPCRNVGEMGGRIDDGGPPPQPLPEADSRPIPGPLIAAYDHMTPARFCLRPTSRGRHTPPTGSK